jgi:hypothetical protein
MDAVSITETGVATGMNTVVRTVGGVVGAQVGAAVLTASRPAGLPVPTESGFTHAFWIGAGAALLGAGAAWMVAPRRRVPHGRPMRAPAPGDVGSTGAGA